MMPAFCPVQETWHRRQPYRCRPAASNRGAETRPSV